MDAEKVGSVGLAVALVAVGAGAWWLQLQPSLEVDTTPLAALPMQIDGWESVEIPLQENVEAVLNADFHVQRSFARGPIGPIWLYVGYYGTARGGRPEHTPRGCYTGAGWGIEATRAVDVDPSSGFSATEYIVERRGQRRLVHFWFRTHRSTGLRGGLDHSFDRVVGRVFDGRADGALVRISTPLHDDETLARSRLLAFAAALDPVLARHWPIETESAQDG